MAFSLSRILPNKELDLTRIPPRTLAYYRQRLRNRVHQLVMREFSKREKAHGFTRTTLAYRIARKKEQISRWLGIAPNWTLDTVSDLLIGMGLELTCDVRDVHAPQAAAKPLTVHPPITLELQDRQREAAFWAFGPHVPQGEPTDLSWLTRKAFTTAPLSNQVASSVFVAHIGAQPGWQG